MQIIITNQITGERWVERTNKNEILIGRLHPGEENSDIDVILNSRYVSYHQATLRQEGKQLFIQHFGLNDTLLNDEVLVMGIESPLNANDEIIIGDFTLIPMSGARGNEQENDEDSEIINTFEQSIHRQLLDKLDLKGSGGVIDPNSEDTQEKIKILLDKILETELAKVDDDKLTIFSKAAINRELSRQITVSGGKNTDTVNVQFNSSVTDMLNRMTQSLEISFDSKKLEQDSSKLSKNFLKLYQQYSLEISGIKQYLSHVYFNNRLLSLIFGLGPLQDLMDMDSISEVMVVSRKQIFIEKFGVIEDARTTFPTDDSLMAVIERIVAPIGRRIDQSSPLVDAHLADGSRVNVIIPPLALKGPCITIRKFSDIPLEFADLIRFGAINDQIARFLLACVQSHKNIIVSGGTGSGKTTLLNCLSDFISPKERIVTIEDTAELQLKQQHVVTLESRPANMEGKGEITIRDLVKNALRMRPDRIIVGECRGGETLDMLQAMNTGHDGSMTTGHANSPKDMMLRLETMVLTGVSMPISAIRAQISAAINIVVQLNRLPGGARRVTCISEIVGIDEQSGEILTEDIYIFQPDKHKGYSKGRFLHTGYMPTFLDELLREELITLDNFF